jgi:hypothetical protein
MAAMDSGRRALTFTTSHLTPLQTALTTAHVPVFGYSYRRYCPRHWVRYQHHRYDCTTPCGRVAHGTLHHHACPQARRERDGGGGARRDPEYIAQVAQHVAVCQPCTVHCYIWRCDQDGQGSRHRGTPARRQAPGAPIDALSPCLMN